MKLAPNREQNPAQQNPIRQTPSQPWPCKTPFRNQHHLNEIKRIYSDIGQRLASDFIPRLKTTSDNIMTTHTQIREIEQQPKPMFGSLKRVAAGQKAPTKILEQSIPATLDVACQSTERLMRDAYTRAWQKLQTSIAKPQLTRSQPRQADPSDVKQLHTFYFMQQLQFMKQQLSQADILDMDNTKGGTLVLRVARQTQPSTVTSQHTVEQLQPYELRCSLPGKLKWEDS